MAENNLKTQLDDIIAGNKQIQKNDNFFVTLSISEADFRGLSPRDLENIESILQNCDDDDLVAKIRGKIEKRREELNITDNTEVKQAEQDNQPSPADSQTKEGDLPHAEFMSVPSYSLYKNYQKLDNKAKNGEANETEGQLTQDYIDNAKKIADSAANEEITPEQAVFLKDYLEILNSAVEEGKKYNGELEARVDEQLKVFDEENGLGKLTPEHKISLETKEKSWHKIAQDHNWDENVDNETMDVLKNLCIQELKIQDDKVITDKVYELFAKKYNTTPDNAQKVCMVLINKHNAGTMKGIDEQLFNDYLNILNAVEIDTFRQKFEDLKAQLEATRAIERAKLIAEELYPENKGMSKAELEEIRKKREEYLKEQLSREGGLPSKKEWIEENALRALRDKHHIADGDDEKIKADLKDEYEELRKAYSHVADEIDTATNTAYVLRVEALANRTARLTGADGLNPQTQKFLQNYAEKNNDSYKVGKMALSIGKSVAISQGVRYAFGFKGMAAYSAYQTSQAVKKSWAKYKESMPNGEKASLLGYCEYLKDNPNELTNIVSKVSKTAVMSSLAVAGTALGIDNIPGVSAAIVGSINAVTAAVKIHQNKDAIKNTWKNRKQIAEDFKNKYPKLKKYAKWGGGLLIGGAVAGTILYKIFAPDEVKDAVDEGLKDLKDEALNKGISLDGQTTAEGASLDGLTKPTNLFGNSSPDQPVLAELKGAGLGQDAVHIGADAPKLDDVNGGNVSDAVQAATDYTDFNLFADETTKGNIEHFIKCPEFSAHKLQELGLVNKETADQMCCSHTKALAKLRELNENATPEQKAKLAEYKEWINDTKARQAEVNDYFMKKARAAVDAKSGDGTLGNGDGTLENGNGNETNPLDQNSKAPETKLTRISSRTNRAFAGIITQHGEVGVQEVASTGNPSLDQVNAAIEQSSSTGGKHIDTSITNENGEVVSKGRFTVKEKDGGYSVKGKLQHGDIKEKIKVEGNTKISTFKGMEASDMDGDGKSEKVVGVATDGNHTYTAVKTSGGQKVIIDDAGNKHSVKGGLKRALKNLVTRGR